MDDNESEGGDDILVEWFFNDILMRRGVSVLDNFNGQFGVATIRLRYEVACSENYYGELCDIFCKGRNDSFGHYFCDEEGNIVCLSGFTNTSTFCTCATSSEDCIQGMYINFMRKECHYFRYTIRSATCSKL